MNDNNVLALVGDRKVTDEDVNHLMKSLGHERAMQFNSPEGKKRLLEELINQELFYLDAVENNIAEDADFKAEIVRMTESLLKQYSINKLLTQVKIDENEIEAYYNENKSSFNTPESVRASHILVDSEQKANEIISEINSGVSFHHAAEKHSSCPSKDRGGDLGYFTRGQMVPEFENAAFNMKPGEISNPVKTQFGYHIIQLQDKKQGGVKPLSEVRDQVAQQLLGQKQEAAYFGKIAELQTKYEVKRV